MARIHLFFDDMKHLLRSIPSPVVALFILSVVMMNLLANKTIVDVSWLALDGGFLVSWLCFLTMDVVSKHYGPHAANKLNLFAVAINLLCSLLFYIAAVIPTSTDYSGFNVIFGGTWFILLSSTVAFLVSGVVNNFLNYGVGKIFRKNPDGKLAFFTRTYVSTFIGQFVDNLTFSVLCFMVFAPIFWDGYSWTFVQCLASAVLGAICELLMEVVFSPFGYWVCRNWKKDKVGEDYFEYQRNLKLRKEETENGAH